jgi:hypothetical protein
MGDPFQDPQWMPELWECCMDCVFNDMYTSVIKFNLQIRDCKWVTATLITKYQKKLCECVLSLSPSLSQNIPPIFRQCPRGAGSQVTDIVMVTQCQATADLWGHIWGRVIDTLGGPGSLSCVEQAPCTAWTHWFVTLSGQSEGGWFDLHTQDSTWFKIYEFFISGIFHSVFLDCTCCG